MSFAYQSQNNLIMQRLNNFFDKTKETLDVGKLVSQTQLIWNSLRK